MKKIRMPLLRKISFCLAVVFLMVACAPFTVAETYTAGYKAPGPLPVPDHIEVYGQDTTDKDVVVGLDIDGSVDVNITGNIDVNGNDTEQSFGVWVFETSTNGWDVSVNVGGDISVASDGEVNGIAVRDEIYNDSDITIEVGSEEDPVDILAESTDYVPYDWNHDEETDLYSSTADGVFVTTPDYTEIIIHGNIDAIASPESIPDAPDDVEIAAGAVGVDLAPSLGLPYPSDRELSTAEINVTVDGTVHAEAPDYAYGTNILYMDPGGTVFVTVGDEMTAKADSAWGVYADSMEHVSTTISTDQIEATGIGDAHGINVHLSEKDTVQVTVNGDIEATATEGYAGGMEIYSDFSETNANSEVNGSITASGTVNAMGVQLDAEGASSLNQMTVNGDIVAKAEEDVRTIQVQADQSGTVQLTVNGDVSADATSSDKEADVKALYAVPYDEQATLEIDIKGNISSNAGQEDRAAAVAIGNAGGKVQIDVSGEITSTGNAIQLENINDYWDLLEETYHDVRQNEKLDHDDSWNDIQDAFEYYKYSLNLEGEPEEYDMYYDAETQQFYMAKDGDEKSVITWHAIDNPVKETNIQLAVMDSDGGDASVSGDEYGLLIESENPNLSADLFIDGTLYGELAGVCVSETAVTDQLMLTVWKIECGDNNHVAATLNNEGNLSENLDFEENNIQYIIRMEQPEEGGSFTVDGASQYQDYDVARKDQKITLKITIQDGFEIAGAYNGSDNPVALLLGDDGNYYLVVPNGGGIDLSVSLKKKETPQEEIPEESNGENPAEEEAFLPVITAEIVPDEDLPAVNVLQNQVVNQGLVVENLTEKDVGKADTEDALETIVTAIEEDQTIISVTLENFSQLLEGLAMEDALAGEQLTVQEKLYLAAMILNINNTELFNNVTLSDRIRELIRTIQNKLASMTEAERQLFDQLTWAFIETRIINGQAVEVRVITLIVEATNSRRTEKFGFRQMNGHWTLAFIEQN